MAFATNPDLTCDDTQNRYGSGWRPTYVTLRSLTPDPSNPWFWHPLPDGHHDTDFSGRRDYLAIAYR